MKSLILFTCTFLLYYNTVAQLILNPTTPPNANVCGTSSYTIDFLVPPNLTTLSLSASVVLGAQPCSSCPIISNPPYPICNVDETPPGTINPVLFSNWTTQQLSGNPFIQGPTYNSVSNTFDFDISNVHPSREDQIQIRFNAFFDCSLIPGGFAQLYFIQEWSTNGPIVQNQPPPVPIHYPHIYDMSPNPVVVNGYYGQQAEMIFSYHNNGYSDVTMDMTFTDLYLQNCVVDPAYSFVSLEFATALYNTSPTSFSPFTGTAFLPEGHVLYIKQTVDVNGCIYNCPLERKVQFTWKCSNAVDFCDICQKTYVTNFIFQPEIPPPSFTVTRTLPSYNDALQLNDCPGESETWNFVITNTSQFTTLHEIDIEFFNLTYNTSLSLINTTPIVTSTCVGCVSPPVVTIGGTTPCSPSGSIQNFLVHIDNLLPGETVNMNFETVLCCTEDENTYLNQAKFFNQWQFRAVSTTACGNTFGPTYTSQTTDANLNGLGGISGHSTNFGHDIHQDMIFTPAVTHLTVPGNQIFGNTPEPYYIQMLPGFFGNNDDMQVLGYNVTTPPPTDITGILRADIFCEQGLIIDNLATDVSFEFTDAGITYIWNPIYFHEGIPNIDPNERCEQDNYYFYFDLSQVPGGTTPKDFLEHGRFHFSLLPCCGEDPPGNAEPANYLVSFSIMMNNDCFSLTVPGTPYPTCTPDPGTTSCCWLPLSSRGWHVFIHCPGCRAPGVIVDRYYMQRRNYGYEDFNNNRIADNTNLINPLPNPAQHIPPLEWNRSVYGDLLEDRMIAHFENGVTSPPPPGYTYQMMTNLGINLGFLQLLNTIPGSELNRMNLEVEGFDLYIDDPGGSGACDDCNDFNGANNSLSTVLRITVTTAGGSTAFMDRQNDQYLYTFNEADLAGQVVPPGANVVYTNYPGNSFSSFEPWQQYRLTVRYRVCGNIHSTNLYYPVPEDLHIASDIFSHLWLIGDPVDFSTQGSWPAQMPMTQDELESNYQISFDLPNCPSCTSYVNQQNLGNAFRFFCEPSGATHHFFSTDYINDSQYHHAVPAPSHPCEKRVIIRSQTSFHRGSLGQIFPNEYKTPGLRADVFNITVPVGFKISATKLPIVYSRYLTPNGNLITNWQMQQFNLPAVCNTCSTQPCQFQIDMNYIENNMVNSIPSPFIQCLQNETFPPNQTTTGLYLSDERTDIYIQVTFEACECTPVTTQNSSSNSIIEFTDNNTCLAVNSCASSPPFIQPNMDYHVDWNLPNPNLFMQLLPPQIYATGNGQVISWNFEITNFQLPVIPAITGAPYVYLQFPDISQVPYLSGWDVINLEIDGVAINAPVVNGNIFGLTTSLGIATLTGTITANYTKCQGTANFNIDWGWNCESFPTFDPGDIICQQSQIQLTVEDAEVEFVVDQYHSVSPEFYTLCGGNASPPQYSIMSACFKNMKAGTVKPDFVTLTSYDPSVINIISVTLKNCNPLLTNTVTLSSPGYAISAADLTTIDIIHQNGFMTQNQCICIIVEFEVLCTSGSLPLPTITVNATDYCGNPLAPPADFPSMEYSYSTYCVNCYTVNKTSSADPVIIGQPLMYTIEVCNYSLGQPVTLTLDDVLPAGFTLNPGPGVTFPMTINNLGMNQCQFVSITGAFTFVDATNCNTAIITHQPSGNTAQSTVCVDVYSSCINEVDYFFSGVNNISDIAQLINGVPSNSLTNVTIGIHGTLYIDIDFTFFGSTLRMEPGAEIIMNTGSGAWLNFILDNTTISGCHQMWRGIVMSGSNLFTLHNFSEISDANIALELTERCSFRFRDSRVRNCVTGIYLRQHPSNNYYSAVSGIVEGTTFEMASASLLPSYSTQPPYTQNKSRAGIDVSHLSAFVLGNNSANRNIFRNMSNGVISRNGNIDIRNSQFLDIITEPFYTSPTQPDFNGSAVTAVALAAPFSSLRISSIVGETQNNPTIGRCDIGINTWRSTALIPFIRILDAIIGVRSRACDNLMTTIINNCTITARDYGIHWTNNDGANQMIADFNMITMTGNYRGTAIFMSEGNPANVANYNISSNRIVLNDGYKGVWARTVNTPFIRYNDIDQFNTNNSFLTTLGIFSESCNAPEILCNNIITTYPTGNNANARGMDFRLSVNNTIQCNLTRGQNRGILFGGNCGGTDFRGNSMELNTRGLEINNVGAISGQTGNQFHLGNTWLGYTGPDGAFNANLTGLSNSLFTVHTQMGQPPAGIQYYPIIPAVNSGWFFPDPNGTPWTCWIFRP
jgi:uncharacterized repeat protein (TIGR01451 family)